MADITDRVLTIRHDHAKNTAHVVVKCKVRFTGLELCLMKSCPEQRMFYLKCQLWGADSGLTGADDFLYTFSNVFNLPDPTPTSPEDRTFDVVVGQSLLDEDWGVDEVYAKLILRNLLSMVEIKRNTNTVSHSF